MNILPFWLCNLVKAREIDYRKCYVVQNDLPGIPHVRQVEFHIDLVPVETPDVQDRYPLAPIEDK